MIGQLSTRQLSCCVRTQLILCRQWYVERNRSTSSPVFSSLTGYTSRLDQEMSHWNDRWPFSRTRSGWVSWYFGLANCTKCEINWNYPKLSSHFPMSKTYDRSRSNYFGSSVLVNDLIKKSQDFAESFRAPKSRPPTPRSSPIKLFAQKLTTV